MKAIPPSNPFGFLTPSREKAFRVAINAANTCQQAAVGEKAHVYDHISKGGRSGITRAWGIGHVMECFSGDEGAVRREIWNMLGIEFDGAYFVRLAKIEDPDFPPPEPRMIIKARHQAAQLSLFNDSTFEDQPTPLRELYPIVGGYILNKAGLITNFYLIDQSDATEVKYRELDLVTKPTNPSDSGNAQPTKTKITLKLKAVKKAEDK